MVAESARLVRQVRRACMRWLQMVAKDGKAGNQGMLCNIDECKPVLCNNRRGMLCLTAMPHGRNHCKPTVHCTSKVPNG